VLDEKDMAKKKTFAVGFTLPGDDFEYVPFDSDQSLLDADIVLYEVGFGKHYAIEYYQGIPLFGHSDSVRIAQNLQHWRSELAAATNAGKLVIVFLAKPLSYFRYTGEQQYSGTGRSRVATNIVTRVGSYDAVPSITSVEAKSGREVRLTKEGAYITPYWGEFAEYSPYEAFIEGKFTHALLTTKTGSKIVGAAIQGKGSLLFLPPLRYDEEKFTKYDSKKKETYWTAEATRFGKRLATTLFALSDTLLSGRLTTPPPPWVLDSAFSTLEEGALHGMIAEVSGRINQLQQQRTELAQRLDEAGSIRALLYEHGKPLERAVCDALTVLGFSAVPFVESDSEFDVVFKSPEGRCVGEVEGKDNKAVNIDKFSQLERNLQEDFAREGVTEYAKGVLFGNAERLKPLAERGEAFTAKCITAAKRVHAALVRTSDLFDPVRYLRNKQDPDYAKACRQAIYSTEGDIVVFPPVPVSVIPDICEESAKIPPTGDVKVE
jgi:hypothetical protein